MSMTGPSWAVNATKGPASAASATSPMPRYAGLISPLPGPWPSAAVGDSIDLSGIFEPFLSSLCRVNLRSADSLGVRIETEDRLVTAE
jgi:hypothetical protein